MSSKRTTWDGEQWSKPLVFLKKTSVEELRRTQNYQIPEELEPLLPIPQVSGEMFLLILVHSGKIPEAVELLCHLITPRVGLWWALRCYHSVMDDIRRDFEKDGLSPAERRKKRADDMVATLTDATDIQAMVTENEKLMDDELKKSEKLIDDMHPMSPAEVIAKKIAAFKQTIVELGLTAPPAPLTPPQLEAQKKIDLWIEEQMSAKMAPYLEAPPAQLPPAMERVSGDRIFAAIEEKTATIAPAVKKDMGKYFPLNIKGLPPLPSQKKKTDAIAAAQRWLLAPTDVNGKLASEAAIAAQSGPEAMLAFTAFWCASNMVTDTGKIPANPALAPLGISKTLYLLAMLEGGEKDYDARYREFLEIGIDCADSTSTWDVFGNEVRNDDRITTTPVKDSVLTRRSGFGRK